MRPVEGVERMVVRVTWMGWLLVDARMVITDEIPLIFWDMDMIFLCMAQRSTRGSWLFVKTVKAWAWPWSPYTPSILLMSKLKFTITVKRVVGILRHDSNVSRSWEVIWQMSEDIEDSW